MTTADDALSVVRCALLDSAGAYAGQVLSDAQDAAAAIVRSAEEEAERLVAVAREEGEADAATVAAGGRARARRDVRAELLRVQREAYDDLVDTVRGEARSLLANRPEIQARLRELAQERLGPQVEVSTRPDGTVVGELGQRRWSWSPDALADDAVSSLGPELARLWTP